MNAASMWGGEHNEGLGDGVLIGLIIIILNILKANSVKS